MRECSYTRPRAARGPEMAGYGYGDAIGRAIVTVAVAGFAAGAIIVGLLVWLWPYLPAIRLDWGR